MSRCRIIEVVDPRSDVLVTGPLSGIVTIKVYKLGYDIYIYTNTHYILHTVYYTMYYILVFISAYAASTRLKSGRLLPGSGSKVPVWMYT